MLLAVLLIVVAAFVVGGRVRDSAVLRQLPEALGDGLNPAEHAAVESAVDRLVSFRFRGAMIGAVVFAVPSLVWNRALTINFVAVLAGATAGIAIAEWRVAAPASGPLRTARLTRRTIAGVVGRLPLALAAIAIVGAVGAGLIWALRRPGVSGEWTDRVGDRVFSTTVPDRASTNIGWAISAAEIAFALFAAVVITRRPASQSLPESADLALREAGVRSALGCAISLAAAQAAVLLFTLPSVAFGPGGPMTHAQHVVDSAFVVGALFMTWLAVAGLVRYVLHPVRRPAPIAVPA